jgi:hypothetical protein
MWIAGAIFILNNTLRDFRNADFEAVMRRKNAAAIRPRVFPSGMA